MDTNYPTEDTIIPVLQVPLRKFKQTYILPLGSPVFDHIRHRGDSTLFKVEWNLIKNAKETKLYKSMIKKFPDANLIDVTPSKKKD